MRVFYVAIFATAALFATAIARPGFTKKRHARKARSIFDNPYQHSQSNQNFDAIPTDWKYNQFDQDVAVPHYPDFPQISNSGWQNQAANYPGQVPQLDNQVGQEYEDESHRLNIGGDTQSIRKDIQDSILAHPVEQEYLRHVEKVADELGRELSLLNNGGDQKDIQKQMEEFINIGRHFNDDKNSGQDFNGDRIPPMQKTHLPDLFQQTNDQNSGSPFFTGQNINDDFTGGLSNDIEPPVHKKLVSTVGQRNNAHEVNTNNNDQYYGGQYPYQKTNQNQDSDDGSNSDWDDSFDDDFEDDDFEDDSMSSESFESEEDSKSVEDQVGFKTPNEGFDGEGSIDRRLGNGLDEFRAQKKHPQAQRWKRSSALYESPALFIEECILICETIRRTGQGSPQQSEICDCANAPHMK